MGIMPPNHSPDAMHCPAARAYCGKRSGFRRVATARVCWSWPLVVAAGRQGGDHQPRHDHLGLPRQLHARGGHEPLPLRLLRRSGEGMYLLTEYDHLLEQACSFTLFRTGPGPLLARSAKPLCGVDMHKAPDKGGKPFVKEHQVMHNMVPIKGLSKGEVSKCPSSSHSPWNV